MTMRLVSVEISCFLLSVYRSISSPSFQSLFVSLLFYSSPVFSTCISFPVFLHYFSIIILSFIVFFFCSVYLPFLHLLSSIHPSIISSFVPYIHPSFLPSFLPSSYSFFLQPFPRLFLFFSSPYIVVMCL